MSRSTQILLIVVAVIAVIAMLVGAVVLAVKVVRTRRLLNELGAGGKWAFYGALIYTIFPVDLLPDPIYLDDMGVLAAALVYLTRLVAKRRAEQGTPALPQQPRQPGRGADQQRR